jgi:hypothetical protein
LSLQDCQDCLRLWQNYIRATGEYLALKTEQKVAILNDDLETAVLLLSQVQAAERVRQQAWEEAETHEFTRHYFKKAA